MEKKGKMCCWRFLLVISVFSYCLGPIATLGLSMRNGRSGFINTWSFQEEKPPIRFNSEGKMKVAIFADLHYGENPESDWGPRADLRSTNATSAILDYEHPDFVIFTGDQLTAENMYPNASAYVHMLLQPLLQRKLSWASVYGNHDIGPNVTRLEILAAEQEYENCYTSQMNASLPGVTNYFLLIYPPEEAEAPEGPAMIWWFLDSRGGRNEDGQQPEYLDAAVVSWFVEQDVKLKATYGTLPALMFFHIPPTQYEGVQETINANPLCTGLVDDDVTAQDIDTGIMKAIVDAGNVKTVFVGHDHGNAWCCFYGTLEVCYNRHTGYGGYGIWERGARVLELNYADLNNGTRNYIRMESGEIVDEFPHRRK